MRAHLPAHLALTRAEPGCLAFDVDPTDDPLVWRVEERFADEAAFDAHQRRVAASAWGTATAGIDRRYEIRGRSRDAAALVAAAWAAEQRLLDPVVRRNPAEVEPLLSEDVVEIGQSGRRFTRDDIVAALHADPGASAGEIGERSSRVVAPDTVLLDYVLAFEGRVSRRSSLWRGVPPRLVFHQAPRCPPEVAPARSSGSRALHRAALTSFQAPMGRCLPASRPCAASKARSDRPARAARRTLRAPMITQNTSPPQRHQEASPPSSRICTAIPTAKIDVAATPHLAPCSRAFESETLLDEGGRRRGGRHPLFLSSLGVVRQGLRPPNANPPRPARRGLLG